MEKMELQKTEDHKPTETNPLYAPWLLNSEKQISQIAATTALEAIKSQSPVIANIALIHSGAAKKILTYLIADVNEFLNVGNSMSGEQAVQTINLILKDEVFKNFKPDDFKVCFDNAKKGYYGKSYNRVDGQIIFEWLTQYAADRVALCEEISDNNHLVEKKKPNLIAPEVVELYKEVLKQKHKNDRSTTKVILAPPGEKHKYVVEQSTIVPHDGNEVEHRKATPIKSERDIFIQKCFNEFFEIWSKSPYKFSNKPEITGLTNKKPTGRFIKHKGRVVDDVEYVELKLKELNAWIKDLKVGDKVYQVERSPKIPGGKWQWEAVVTKIDPAYIETAFERDSSLEWLQEIIESLAPNQRTYGKITMKNYYAPDGTINIEKTLLP